MRNKKRSREGILFITTVLLLAGITYAALKVNMVIALIIGVLFMIFYYAQAAGSEVPAQDVAELAPDREPCMDKVASVAAAVEKRFPGTRWRYIDQTHIGLIIGGHSSTARLVNVGGSVRIRMQRKTVPAERLATDRQRPHA